jgi:hypothetical protein
MTGVAVIFEPWLRANQPRDLLLVALRRQSRPQKDLQSPRLKAVARFCAA